MFEQWPIRPETDSWKEQRITRNPYERKRRAEAIKKFLNEKTNISFENVDIEHLNKKGFSQPQQFISQELAQQMYDFFSKKKCYDFYGKHESFEIANVPEHIKLGRHTIKDNLECPGFIDIMTNENITRTASSYLGAPATLSMAFAMWSFVDPHSAPREMQLFHRDSDDYKFLKFFIFLSETEIGNGQQSFVQSSHIDYSMPSEFYRLGRFSEESIRENENNKIVNFTGPPGTGWFVDTYGLHKGSVPRKTNRLMIQLQFTYTPVPLYNYEKTKYSDWDQMSDLVKYSNRLYLKK